MCAATRAGGAIVVAVYVSVVSLSACLVQGQSKGASIDAGSLYLQKDGKSM